MIGSPASTSAVAFSTSPIAGMPSARATMAIWLVGPAFLEHKAAQARAVVIEERGRAHGARDQDGVLRQRAVARATKARPTS